MKLFEGQTFSLKTCLEEVTQFAALLESQSELSEREHVLPFFRKRPQLAALIGTYVPDIANPDLVAFEYDLFGDFVCDLAVGDSYSKTFLLVEFEDARPKSLFISDRGRTTPEWAPRLEHGISQVIDWFWKLSDAEKSDDYENRFGTRRAAIHGLVVVGRDQPLQPREQARLKWRQDHTVVDSRRLSIVTYDQLLRDLKYRLQRYPLLASMGPDDSA